MAQTVGGRCHCAGAPGNSPAAELQPTSCCILRGVLGQADPAASAPGWCVLRPAREACTPRQGAAEAVLSPFMRAKWGEVALRAKGKAAAGALLWIPHGPRLTSSYPFANHQPVRRLPARAVRQDSDPLPLQEWAQQRDLNEQSGPDAWNPHQLCLPPQEGRQHLEHTAPQRAQRT